MENSKRDIKLCFFKAFCDHKFCEKLEMRMISATSEQKESPVESCQKAESTLVLQKAFKKCHAVPYPKLQTSTLDRVLS